MRRIYLQLCGIGGVGWLRSATNDDHRKAAAAREDCEKLRCENKGNINESENYSDTFRHSINPRHHSIPKHGEEEEEESLQVSKVRSLSLENISI